LSYCCVTFFCTVLLFNGFRTPAPSVKTNAGAAAAGTNSMAANCEVELDIFSGMPNPNWPLTKTEASHFLMRLKALPPTAAKKPPGNLGYRGFIVLLTQGDHAASIRIHQGTAQITKQGVTVYFHDDGRELERWLFEIGRSHLQSEVAQTVDRQF
jgi:hypothetical protein